MILDHDKLLHSLDYAEHIKALTIRKTTMEERIKELRDSLLSTRSTIGERVATSPSPDAIPNAVAELDELIRKYVIELREYVDEITTFADALKNLEPLHEQVLSFRYIQGLEYRQIAEKMHYHERSIYNFRDFALVELYEYLPNEWKR